METENKELEQQEQETIETTSEENVPKTFTQDEVDKMLQSESDKRVTNALAKAKEKWLVEAENEKAEAQKLAAMTQDERIQAEILKEKEAFESERATFLKEKMEMSAIKELAHEKLPTEFVKFVVGNTEEELKENINIFKEVWSEAIKAAVDNKLVGKVPMGQNTETAIKAMSKDEFSKLPYKQRQTLLEKDPDILKKLK